MVYVITCAIFGDYRLRGVSLVRGVILPSPIDLRYRDQGSRIRSVRILDGYVRKQE